MEPGCGDPSVLPCWRWPRRQPALWPALAVLALLSSVSEASLGPAPRSPATREGLAPARVPLAGHLLGGRAARPCGGRARRPPPQPPRPGPPPPAPSPSRGGRAARARGRGGREHTSGEEEGCHLISELVSVSLLGLGHSSDELVYFSFCSGSCHRRAPSQHDLSLARLLGAGVLKQPVSQPCCRPTRYKAVTFMDVNSTWRTVDRLSATACSCLG